MLTTRRLPDKGGQERNPAVALLMGRMGGLWWLARIGLAWAAAGALHWSGYPLAVLALAAAMISKLRKSVALIRTVNRSNLVCHATHATASLTLPSAKVMAYTYLVPTWVALWQVGLGHALPPVMVPGGVGLTMLALVLLLKDESAPVR